jgi:hypothetical protein
MGRLGSLAAVAGLIFTITASAQELRTLKERLSDKASDNQRVDNCHVPPERRGPVPRPNCPVKSSSSVLATAPPGRR